MKVSSSLFARRLWNFHISARSCLDTRGGAPRRTWSQQIMVLGLAAPRYTPRLPPLLSVAQASAANDREPASLSPRSEYIKSCFPLPPPPKATRESARSSGPNLKQPQAKPGECCVSCFSQSQNKAQESAGEQQQVVTLSRSRESFSGIQNAQQQVQFCSLSSELGV